MRGTRRGLIIVGVAAAFAVVGWLAWRCEVGAWVEFRPAVLEQYGGTPEWREAPELATKENIEAIRQYLHETYREYRWDGGGLFIRRGDGDIENRGNLTMNALSIN